MSNDMQRVNLLIMRLRQVESDIVNLTELMEKAQLMQRTLQEKMIPEAMIELSLSEVVTQDGTRVALREEIRAAFPKDPEKRTLVYQWLDANGHAGLVKNFYTVTFSKDDAAHAEAFGETMRRLKIADHAKVEQKQDIHHQTLLAFLREQLADGTDVPLELFGAFVQKFAKVTTK